VILSKYWTYIQYLFIVLSMKPLSTQEAARALDIGRSTLQVWIAEGKVDAPEVQLVDGKAVRLWKAKDLARLKAVKARMYRRGRGRKKGTKGKGGRR